MSIPIAAVLVGLGLAFLSVGMLSRVYRREQQLSEILDLPYGEHDVALGAVIDQHSAIVENLSGLAGKMVSSFDERGALLGRLEKARLPVRPGEFVVIAASAAVALGAFVMAITGQWLAGVIAVGTSPLLANTYINFRIARRKKKFEAQFPDALSLIAGSLSAGHTFLRAIQMMTEESPAPLSEEFARVINETQLGDPVVYALGRMAKRLDIRDVDWVVQAIRIQQTVGGKLADLLHTLADFIRAREEIRREVDVLTAEGRISAYVLGGLPVLLLLAISTMNPGYMDPMYTGWGPVWLGGAGVSAGIGVLVINKMVKIEV
ncbi:MAG: type II secretion system F family protein [Acidimicrobiales bacterium]